MSEMKFETTRKLIEYAVEFVRTTGQKWETVSKGLLEKASIKAPWDNFYHIVKNAPVDKDLLLKLYWAITHADVRTGRNGEHHAKTRLLNKIKANFAKDGLKDEATIEKAASKFAGKVVVAAPKAEKKVVPAAKKQPEKQAASAGPEVKKPAEKATPAPKKAAAKK